MQRATGISAARIGRFVRAHLKWVLLGPLIMVFGTALHELVHCAAALITGGTLTELHLLPTRLNGRFVFGYMNAYDHDEVWTKVAPALFSSCVATFAYAWLGELKPGRGATLCFLLFYLLPLFDVSMAVMAVSRQVESADLWVLSDHVPELTAAAVVFFALHLWAVPRLFHDALSDAEVRLLVAAFLLIPALRFL
jgi:hypothetical protein